MPEAVPGPALLGIVKKRWRAWLRSFHRDLGYLTVGLTIIYAVSGLAINHIGSWDPNFKTFHKETHIATIAADVPDDQAIAKAAAAIGLAGDSAAMKGAARYGDEIHFEEPDHTIVVYGDSGLVVEDGRQSRFFLRMANWLHEVRGKKAWMYIADLYAVILLYLAISGLFMIKGKLGLKWRGLGFVGAGVLVPTMYVILSGGPGAKGDKPDAAAVSGDATTETTAKPSTDGTDGAKDTPGASETPGASDKPRSEPSPASPSTKDDVAPPEERMQPRVPVERPPVRVPAPAAQPPSTNQ